MTDTPRLRSAFPQTPRTPQRNQGLEGLHGTPPGARFGGMPKDEVLPQNPAAQDTNKPLIPFGVIDAPSQRLYVMTFYIALNAWRMYEHWMSSDVLDSTWLFLKWISIDGIFLFGLPALRIPWLEWSFSTTLAVYLVHAVANVFLMFRIPVSYYGCLKNLS